MSYKYFVSYQLTVFIASDNIETRMENGEVVRDKLISDINDIEEIEKLFADWHKIEESVGHVDVVIINFKLFDGD